MKKLSAIILLILVLTLSALRIFAQSAPQTYWTTSPTGWTAITNAAFRYKGVTPDSLNSVLLFNPLTVRYNEIYTAAKSNQRYKLKTDSNAASNGGFVTYYFWNHNKGSASKSYIDSTNAAIFTHAHTWSVDQTFNANILMGGGYHLSGWDGSTDTWNSWVIQKNPVFANAGFKSDGSSLFSGGYGVVTFMPSATDLSPMQLGVGNAYSPDSRLYVSGGSYPGVKRVLTELDIPGGGIGTVSTVSVVSANGLSGTVANATTTPAITLTLGTIKPNVVAQTPAGTAGTDSVMVKHSGGVIEAISPAYYLSTGSAILNQSTLQTGAIYNVDRGLINQADAATVSVPTAGSYVAPFNAVGGKAASNTFSGSSAQGGLGREIDIIGSDGGDILGTPTTGNGGDGATILVRGGAGGLGTTLGGTGGPAILQGGRGGTGPGGVPGYASMKGGFSAIGSNASGGNLYLTPGGGDGTGHAGTTFLDVSPANVVRGNVVIGSSTDDYINVLQVTGSALFNNAVTASSVSTGSEIITGTSGKGLELTKQSGAHTAPATGTEDIYNNSNGQTSLMGHNGFEAALTKSAMSASHVYTFPNADITFLGEANTATVTNKTLSLTGSNVFSGYTAGSIPAANSSGNLTEYANVFLWDATTGQLVINKNATTTAPLLSTGQGFYTQGADGATITNTIDAIASNGSLQFRRSDNTASSRTAVAANDILGTVAAMAYNGSAYGNSSAQVQFTAAEAGTTGLGGNVLIRTTVVGGAGPGTKAEIFADGSMALQNAGSFATVSAELFQLNSTTRAFGMPTVTTTQKNAISSPVERDEVYDNTLHAPSWYNGGGWVQPVINGVAGSTSTPSINFGTSNTGIYAGSSARIDMTFAGTNLFRWDSNGNFDLLSNAAPTNGGVNWGVSADITLVRAAAAELQQGNSSATPVANTLHGAAGNGTNIAGASYSLAGGKGTGTGVGGDFLIKYAPAGTTGSSLNPYSTAIMVSGTNGNVDFTKLFSFNGAAGTASQIPIVNAGATAMTWATASVTQASADLPAQSAAGNITTFTVGAATSTFNISAYINVTAVVTDIIEVQVTYTDENSAAQTVTFTTLNTISDSAYNPVTIRAKNGTVITVKTTLTVGAGTITFDAGARISQL